MEADNEGPDDLAVFLAEQMADPEFVAVYEALAAERAVEVIGALMAENERLRVAIEEIALAVRSDEHGELPAGAHFAIGAVRKVILVCTSAPSDADQ